MELAERLRLGTSPGPGMPPAFEDLFRREYPRVVAIAHRVVADSDEAEDVAQDVFVSFYRKHPAEAHYAAPWLYAAAALGLRQSSIGTLLRRAEDAFRKEVTK